MGRSSRTRHGCSLLKQEPATFDRHISFSLEGDVHVRTEVRVARHRGGHRSAGSQRVHADPFSPFVPWQIDDNPTLFISVNVYDTLLRTTKDGTAVEAGLATKWTPS